MPMPKKRVPPKNCKVCGKSFTRRPDERGKRFHNRQTCSAKCGHTLRMEKLREQAEAQKQKRLPAKVCVICGEEFKQKPKEYPSTFRKRNTCGASCGSSLANRNRRRHAEELGRNYKHALPDAVVDNWAMLAPTCAAVMNLLKCGDGTAYKVAHRHGLSFAGDRNGNLFCLNNFMDAEKAYARYAARGLRY